MLLMANCLAGRRHKNATHLKCRNFCCFIPLIQFLNARTDNEHNVQGRFFVLVRTRSSHIFEWYNHSLSLTKLVSVMPPATKERELKNSTSFNGIHITVNPHFCLEWVELPDQPSDNYLDDRSIWLILAIFG